MRGLTKKGGGYFFIIRDDDQHTYFVSAVVVCNMLCDKPFFSSLLLPPKPSLGFPAAGRPCCSLRASLSSPSPTFYELLQLPPHVGLSDIKDAYRQLVRKYHPDVCPPDQSEESTRRFIEIQEAYETLSDPRRRAIYDQAVAMGVGSSSPGLPWNMVDKDAQPSDWRSQWESQLSGLKRRSAMKAQKADSWASRMRRQNGQ